MKIDKKRICSKMIFLSSLIFPLSVNLHAQVNQGADYHRDTLLTAAKELIAATRYCALITLDESGHPQVRTMDPFAPEKDMVIWLGTNPNSRKVKEIKNDPRVTLYYESSGGRGYLVLKGHASLVNDPAIKSKYWKKEWDQFYSDNDANYILIKVMPNKLEIVDYKRGIVGESKTWAVPSVEFDSGK
jgi:general stress protein 26